MKYGTTVMRLAFVATGAMVTVGVAFLQGRQLPDVQEVEVVERRVVQPEPTRVLVGNRVEDRHDVEESAAEGSRIADVRQQDGARPDPDAGERRVLSAAAGRIAPQRAEQAPSWVGRVLAAINPWASGSGDPAATSPAAVAGGGATSTTDPAPGAGQTPNLPLVEFIGMSYQGTAMNQAEFSIAALRDLKVLVWWNVAGSGHIQKLDFYAPDGSLYRRLATGIDETLLGLNGRPAEILVETLLPVAGTWITEHSLLGTWTVNVHLDGATSPVASAAFTIYP